MKKACLIAFICLAFIACKYTLTPQERKLCGKWMFVGEKYNSEWFDFKPDGSFVDERFTSDMIKSMPQPVTFAIVDGKLVLTYEHLIYLHYKANYKIISITDSTLFLITPGTKRYPSKIINLKKMKLNGKFITT